MEYGFGLFRLQEEGKAELIHSLKQDLVITLLPKIIYA